MLHVYCNTVLIQLHLLRKLLPTRVLARYAKQLPFSANQEELEASLQGLDFEKKMPRGHCAAV